MKQRILLEATLAAILGRGSAPARLARAGRMSKVYNAQFAQETGPTRPIVELAAADATPAKVAALTNGYRRPLVIRGLARDHLAVRAWSPDSFARRLPDAHCTVVRPLDDPGFALGELPKERLPVAEFMERALTEPLYLNNSTELFAIDPSLVDELELPRLKAAMFGASRTTQLFATQIFIGSQGVHSRLHHAVGGNAFVQVRGRKHWTFVDPKHTARLMPVPGSPFYFSVSGHGGFRRRRELGLPPGVLAGVPRHETLLEPGDVLYNAPWWWHEVENLDAGTIGCAVRRLPPLGTVSPSLQNIPQFTLAMAYPVRRLLAGIIEGATWLGGGKTTFTRRANRQLHERLHTSLTERSRD